MVDFVKKCGLNLEEILLLLFLFATVFIVTENCFCGVSDHNPVIDYLDIVFRGLIPAYIFYLFQVYFPNKKREKNVKKRFKKEYINFKKQLARKFISVFKIPTEEEIESFLDLKEVKKYLNENVIEDDSGPSTRSGMIRDYFYDKDKEYIFEDLITDIRLFLKEVDYLEQNIDTISYGSISNLKTMQSLNYMTYNNVNKEDLFTDLFFIFTGCNGTTNKAEDPILKILDNI
jgi:hypothetical protein